MVVKLVLDRARPYQARRAAGHGAARFLNARAVPGLFFWPGGPIRHGPAGAAGLIRPGLIGPGRIVPGLGPDRAARLAIYTLTAQYSKLVVALFSRLNSSA
jgi:hypothetical protein